MATPRITIPRDFNAADELVDRNLREGRGDRIAFRGEGRTLTYRQFAELVNRVGNALGGLGVEMEDRVFLALYDSVELAAAFFGAIKIGAVPVPLNTMLGRDEYAYLLDDGRARVLVAEPELAAEIAPARGALRHLRHVVVRRSKGAELDFDAQVAAASPELEPAPTRKDDAAFWLYSSGSTGAPKAAVHLQKDMIFCADLYAGAVLGIRPDDVIFSAAKLFFAYGLGNSLYCPLRFGASSILVAERPRAESILETIARERPTLFFAVPTLYASMLAIPDAERRYDLSSIRLAVSAGERLPADLYLRCRERFGFEVLDGIGSTEVLHVFISNRPGQVRPGSSGTLVPGYDARIVDESEAPVPDGEVGNLLIRGDSTCAFYWNQHEATRRTIRGEWIATGDKYTRDADGYFWYAGRSDDMMKVGGQWVSPVEVEEVLAAHPAVVEAAVAGVEDSNGLVKPRAWVVLKQGTAPSKTLEDELAAFVRARIAAFKCPRAFTFVADLPRTATGKLQRFELRRRAAEGA